MKKLFLALTTCMTLFLTACFAPTQTTISQYDAQGKLVKTTVTSQSVIKSVVESTKDKSLITWQSGWAAYMSASTATTEDPMPTIKMGAGKIDKGMITLHKDHKDLKVEQIIKATRSQLTVSSTGVSQKK